MPQVQGTKFRTDATRLAQQSQFIDDMLFNDPEDVLGVNKEGTDANPIQVPGCTTESFAHFLMWFNHTYVYSLLSH